MGRRGPTPPRGSKARGLRTRLLRIVRIVVGYATPWRVLMVLVVAAGLFGAVAVDHPLAQIAGVAVSALAILTLLAQLNHTLKRVGSLGRDADGSSWAVTGQRHRIGQSRAIVSVVIPGKNEARYARDCIESLKDQTLENFEAVIIDDCSTDSTLDVVIDAVGDDPRFRVIRTDRSGGAGLARNHGVSHSTAKYVTFLDLDDFLAPDALASRVDLAEQHADMPWVAGSYCWHEGVDAEATPTAWRPPTTTRGETISWMGHHDDNFFIVAAPVLRRDAFLAVGGFDDASTAEDAVFWFKLVRWGFVLVGTGTVGIAYRQKAASRAVSTAVEMRNTITRLLTERSEAREAPHDQAGPYFFADALGRYQAAVGYTRRTAAALGIAVAGGAASTVIDRLLDDLRSVPPPLVGWAVDVGALAAGASKRVTRPRRERAKEGPIAREVDRLVYPLIQTAQHDAAKWLRVSERPTLPTGDTTARPVRRPTLLPVTPESLKSLVRTGRPFLLLPSAAYHTDELIELVEEMRRRGFALVAMLNNRRWATTGRALSRVDVPTVKALPPGDWLLDFEAILTFNDFGEYYGRYVQHLQGSQTVSFAKVEGVQDWDDHDTGRVRDAYLASDVVLCQGENDVRALSGKRDRLEVIGSARLEAIWNDRLPADVEPRVVGNVNFTYGVQSEHRDLWVETLRDACRRSKVPLDLSLHPSEAVEYPGLAATEPLRHLLIPDSILVSRFSTVLFEGMARGCSVIYYNPHGERVPTFQHPNGAFDVAEDPNTLTELIEASKSRTRAEAKERATEFFKSQVSIVPGESVATRTADAVERALGR